ncbi:MAG: alcohol dehydrogenase catalytic domain-containing protein [Nitrospirae bacterium]|nr:alcohol dehydrogenase catalytic domain-containing protein [Nitrospirota bacterium]
MAVRSYGSVDRLELLDLPEPRLGENEIRIQVHGSAVNPADSKVLTGKVKLLHARNFPLIVGYDFAGEIDVLGSGIADFRPGDRIFGFLPYPWKTVKELLARKSWRTFTPSTKCRLRFLLSEQELVRLLLSPPFKCFAVPSQKRREIVFL